VKSSASVYPEVNQTFFLKVSFDISIVISEYKTNVCVYKAFQNYLELMKFSLA